MRKHMACAAFVLLLSSAFTVAQTPGQPPASLPQPNRQAAPAPNQLTPQMLGEMLRSATTFHDLVRSMNLNHALGPDQHTQGPDGQLQHPMVRTAETMGAGVGAGVAIGEMTHSRNGVLIGALIGGAGGLILDQIVKRQEEVRAKAIRDAEPEDHSQAPRERYHDPDRRSN